MNPCITVLLSSYNGQNFIKKQIESILTQKNVVISLLIRDDGSTDETLDIIREMQNKYNNIKLIEGNNLGFEMSFNWLVKNSSGSEYYAFADQDDIWKPEKLIKGIEFLKNETGPCLYCSNLNIVDRNLQNNHLLYTDNYDFQTVLNKYYYLFNGFGCTMVWNNKLHLEMKKINNKYKITQDTLANIVAGAKGKIIYDKNSYIYHVIHETNAAGIKPNSIIGKLQKYFARYFLNKKSLQKIQICNIINEQYQIETPFMNLIVNYKKGSLNKLRLIMSIKKIADIPKFEKRKFIILVTFGKL